MCENLRDLAYQNAIFGLVEREDPKWFAHEYIANASLMECVLERIDGSRITQLFCVDKYDYLERKRNS